MDGLQRRYLYAIVLGLLLMAAGAALWRWCGPLFLPSLPGVRVPTSPFLLAAGFCLTTVSCLLYREEKKK